MAAQGALKVRLPGPTNRLAVIGRTGSGKTVAAVWHLSKMPWDRMPFVIFDFKMDDLIGQIPRLEEIDIGQKAPTHPGLYVVHPLPNEGEVVNDFLWKIWARENTGIYVDEGYMIGDGQAFRATLTQGRSKHIPMIVLSQRPVWLSRFVWSESDFYQIFHLNNAQDRKAVQQFVPARVDDKLPEFNSYYYDVAKDGLVVLRPVPDGDTILQTFEDRQRSRRRAI
jgi:hypothetical protein